MYIYICILSLNFVIYYNTYFDKVYILSARFLYRVAKTHRMPYLYRSFAAKEPYNALLRKMTCNLRHPIGLGHPVVIERMNSIMYVFNETSYIQYIHIQQYICIRVYMYTYIQSHMSKCVSGMYNSMN